MRRLLVAFAVVAAVTAPSAWAVQRMVSGSAPTVSAGDWTRYGRDAQVTNDVPLATAQTLGLTAANAASLQQRWRADLDGRIVASPLYVDGKIYVATEGGSMYALSAADGSILWHRSFPTYTPDAPDCGSYGISSTGVIDTTRNVVYVATADGMIHALDLDTGADAAGWPLQMPFDPTTGYVWGALTLVGDTLYVPVASFCDNRGATSDLYPTGGLYALDTSAPKVLGEFAVSPPNSLGGIWGYGGASVDPLTGDLWVTTGNSEPLGAGETQGYAESVVQLDPSLEVVAWNRPSGIPDQYLDSDFGSTPLLFQPNGCPPLAAAYNKNGELYVWNRDNLGGGPIWSMVTGPDDLATPFVGEPSWSDDLQTLVVANARVYDPTAPSGVLDFTATAGFTVGPSCTFPDKQTWVAPDIGLGVKPPPLIVGDLAFIAGGGSSAFNVLNAGTGALLRTFFLENKLYSTPIVAGDEVVVGNGAGTVFAFAAAPTG